MGFNTWYVDRTSLRESTVLAAARAMVSDGLVKAGYRSVSLDDGWMAKTRTASGAFTWDPAKFPHGIPWLAAQLSSMGLSLGIYTGIGTKTCQDYPGSWGHYAQDADTFASWGASLVKVDQCGGLPTWENQGYLTKQYEQFGTDLRAHNPSVTYSAERPTYDTQGSPAWYSAVAVTSTFANLWGVASNEYPLSHADAAPIIMRHLALDVHLHAYAGTSNGGHWNDLDMIAPDLPESGWTLGDLRSQLSVWAEEASPLLISADLSKITPAELAALENPHMIAINQSGAQAAKGLTSGRIGALVKPDPEGGFAVLLANPGTGTSTGHFTLAQIGITASKANGYNIWTGRTATFGGISVTLGAGQTELLRVYQ
jgi:alpha-galactosidase